MENISPGTEWATLATKGGMKMNGLFYLKGMGQPMGAKFGEVPSPDVDEDVIECMEDCDTCVWRSAVPESDGHYRCNDVYGEGYKEKNE